MKIAALNVVLICGAFASTAVFAQGGGNGQGGTGGGNAHSAATAGMTYHGDPISSPMSPMYSMPGAMSDATSMSIGKPSSQSMSPDNATPPAKTGQ
jgi:hypothetical protein